MGGLFTLLVITTAPAYTRQLSFHRGSKPSCTAQMVIHRFQQGGVNGQGSALGLDLSVSIPSSDLVFFNIFGILP